MANNKKIVSLVLMCMVGILATGCSDDNPTSVGQVDTAPPAVPSNLRSTFDYAAGAAVITWAENTVDGDLAGYVVTRENAGVVVAIVPTPQMIQAVEDADVCRGINTYNVYAVDLAGNQSAVAQAVVTRPLAHGTGNLSH